VEYSWLQPNGASNDEESYLPELFAEAQWKRLAAHFELSPRHSQIARLMCLGLRKEAVARTLRLAPSTVRMHTIELFKRLNVRDRIGIPVRLILADRELRQRKRQHPPDERPY
jgi:DNA-binding NarL/FixJ family response regulator